MMTKQKWYAERTPEGPYVSVGMPNSETGFYTFAIEDAVNAANLHNEGDKSAEKLRQAIEKNPDLGQLIMNLRDGLYSKGDIVAMLAME